MQGFVTLAVSGESLNFDLINKLIGLSPDRIIKKGEEMSLKKISLEDKCIYKLKFQSNDFNEKVNIFLCSLMKSKENFDNVIEIANVELNIYINSNFGQIGYTLTKDNICKLYELGIDVQFHILSFGEV